MQVLSLAPIQAPISLLEKTPAILEQLLHEVLPEVLQWKPGPERWSIQEVLAHLAVIEQIYSKRVRQIVMEEDPVLVKYVASSDNEIQKKTAREHREHFIALRRAHIVFPHTVPAAAASRTGYHPEMGRVSVSHLLHELANHDLGHLRQMAELIVLIPFTRMQGLFRNILTPNHEHST